MKRVCAITLALLPLMLAAVPMFWLSSKSGVEWAYSLWGTKHVLNFGGNPSEVYSHLLNWIVMTACVGGVCSAVFASLILGHKPTSHSGFGVLPAAILVFTVCVLLAWAGYLDSRSGERAVVASFVLLFGPCTALLFFAARRLLTCGASRNAQMLATAALFAVSFVLQWIYQPSESGGPNWLALPLLITQVALFWIAVVWLRRYRGAEPSLS
jgi:hypothetical protein